MRLLFDENLSFRLVRELADVYPGSAHRILPTQASTLPALATLILPSLTKNSRMASRASFSGSSPRTSTTSGGRSSLIVMMYLRSKSL